MQIVLCENKRSPIQGNLVGEQEFRYELDFSWAKWPDGQEGTHTLNGCFDEQGRLYVATEDREHPVALFSSGGDYLGSIGKGLFEKAHSVFLTPNKTILTADTSKNSHVIREMDLAGTWIRDFGTLGKPGDSGYDFDYLEILRKNGKIPENPEWNKRAEANARLDSVRRLGTPFCRPCAMVMNEQGEYFAADGYGNAAVHRFRQDGSYDCSWGGPGNEVGQFRLVHDVRLDMRGRVWVSDRENRRVQIFSQDGQALAVILGNLMRIGAVWLDEKYAYIGELDGGITILDLDLNVKAQLGEAGSCIHAHGITADREGNLYIFTNRKNDNTILRLTKR